jgi:hypothetical protein
VNVPYYWEMLVLSTESEQVFNVKEQKREHTKRLGGWGPSY